MLRSAVPSSLSNTSVRKKKFREGTSRIFFIGLPTAFHADRQDDDHALGDYQCKTDRTETKCSDEMFTSCRKLWRDSRLCLTKLLGVYEPQVAILRSCLCAKQRSWFNRHRTELVERLPKRSDAESETLPATVRGETLMRTGPNSRALQRAISERKLRI